MPRIDIELTSSRTDGSWTWRAAGARQPKGTLDGSLLSGGAKVGDVLKADIEVGIDGMTVTAVSSPKAKKEDEGRLELLGPPPSDRPTPSVTTTWTGGDGDGRERSRRPPGGDRDRPGGGGPRRDRPASPGGPGGRPSTGRPTAGRPTTPGARPERTGPPRSDRGGPPRGDRPERGERERGGPPRSDRGAQPRADRGPQRERPARPAAPAPTPRPRPKRLNAGRVHRDRALASLPPEQRPIAEHLLRGGMPAVRQALDDQNATARAAGAPEVKADALLELAEQLLPPLRAAEWMDRAEAAVAQADEVALRDLRALVAGADAAGREEAGRELAGRLRRALDDRSTKERDSWVAEVTEALEAGRVVRALRASARPPEPGARFPAPLAERLSAAASEAMGPDVAPDRWAAVLEAVTSSPVRRLVKPQGLPGEAPAELVQAARVAADRVPGLVALVGEPLPSSAPAGRRGPGASAGSRPGGPTAPPRRRPPAPPGGRRPPAPPPPPPTTADGTPSAPPSPPATAASAPAPAPAETEPTDSAEGPGLAAPTPEATATAPPSTDTADQAQEAGYAAPPDEAPAPPAAARTDETADTADTGAARPDEPPTQQDSQSTAGPGEVDTGADEAQPRPAEVSDDRGDDAVLVEELG